MCDYRQVFENLKGYYNRNHYFLKEPYQYFTKEQYTFNDLISTSVFILWAMVCFCFVGVLFMAFYRFCEIIYNKINGKSVDRGSSIVEIEL